MEQKMSPIDKTREISLSSTSSTCSYHSSNKVNLCFSEISIGRDKYFTGDYVLIKSSQDYEVAKLLCMFLTYEETTAALVKRYVFARNLKATFKKHGYLMDEQNEVVAEDSKDYVIDLHQILGKCRLILLLEDEDPDYIHINKLNARTNFILRFSFICNRLHPILGETTILSESSLNSPSSKLKTSKKQTKNMGSENTPDLLVKQHYTNKNDVSTPRKNSVKRNLNKSFGDSPQDNNNSILNYSIVNITDDENDKPLVVKLRVSDKNRSAAKKVHAETENDGDISPPIRKSKRNVARQSYADYISPMKSTPSKRQLVKTENSSEEEECSPSKYKLPKNTPRTLNGSSRKKTINESQVSSKRKVTTPQRFSEYLDSVSERSPRITPARRSLRFPQNDDKKSPTASSRSGRSRRISYNEDDLAMGTRSNLDDSMRTRILKVKLSQLDMESEEENTLEEGHKDEENRVTHNDSDSNREDNQNSLNNRTPRSKRKPNKFLTSSNDDSDYIVSTPKSRKKHPDAKTSPKPSIPESSRVKQTPRSSTRQSPKSSKQTPKNNVGLTPKTPGSRLKLIREGVVTPSMHARSEKVTGDTTPLMRARSQLHVSYVPESLPCREKEYCDVFNFIEGKLLDGCGGCMYISGVPGTGKTATVTSVIRSLSQNNDVPDFTFVNINGMRLTEPRQSYVEILKQLSGKTIPWEQAQSNLEKLFIKSKSMKPIVMLIDELDILCTKRQDVVYNLLDWPTKAKNQLVVITIANTMDLPERLLMSRVTSRLGLTRLTFHAYTHKQLQEIVKKRLFGIDSFNPDAVQFVARKVASVSGDARRALDICRRAAEIAEKEGKTQLVSMNHVNEALDAMITQPKIRAIKACSTLEQLIMQSIVAEVGRTGVEETTFADVFKMFETCAAIEGFRRVSTTVAMSAVYRLSACRLILTDQKCNDIHQRIILNVSVDDVHYALKND